MKMIALLVLAPAILGQQPTGAQTPADLAAGQKEHARIAALLKKPLERTDMVIEYRPIKGLKHTSRWQIGKSDWAVRLHYAEGLVDMNNLDTESSYQSKGVLLEQHNGVVEIWMQILKIIED